MIKKGAAKKHLHQQPQKNFCGCWCNFFSPPPDKGSSRPGAQDLFACNWRWHPHTNQACTAWPVLSFSLTSSWSFPRRANSGCSNDTRGVIRSSELRSLMFLTLATVSSSVSVCLSLSLPLSLPLSLSLSHSQRAHLTHNIPSAAALGIIRNGNVSHPRSITFPAGAYYNFLLPHPVSLTQCASRSQAVLLAGFCRLPDDYVVRRSLNQKNIQSPDLSHSSISPPAKSQNPSPSLHPTTDKLGFSGCLE